MLFFGSKKFKSQTIFIGQYVGVGSLVIISLIGSFIGNFIDERYVGLLGLFPIYLAVKGFISIFKHDQHEEADDLNVGSLGVLSIAGVTIANGADNIGVYVPLFTTMTNTEKLEMIIVFIMMVYVWCMAGKFLSSRPIVAKQIDRYGHIAMPVVLFLLGIFILLESGSHHLLNMNS